MSSVRILESIQEEPGYAEDSLVPVAPGYAEDSLVPREGLTKMVQDILDVKEGRKIDKETQRRVFWNRYNPFDIEDGDAFLVGGDFFNILFLGFQTVQSFSQVVAAIPIVQSFTLFFGVLGGIINSVVGVACLVKGAGECVKGHWTNGVRLLVDGVLMVAIGVIMIAEPILIKFAPTMAITIVLSNPVILSVLFAALSIFITYEILWRLVPIWRGTDLGARLMARLDEGVFSRDEIDQALQICLPSLTLASVQERCREQRSIQADLRLALGAREDVVESVRDLYREKEEDTFLESLRALATLIQSNTVLIQDNAAFFRNEMDPVRGGTTGQVEEVVKRHQVAGNELCATIEVVEECVGVAAAIEVFRMIMLLMKLESQDNLQELQGEIAMQREVLRPLFEEWKTAQHVRLLQQILYIAASIVSIVALRLAPHVARLLNGIVNTFMTFANVIPLYMDLMWTFNRNVPVLVPRVELQDIGLGLPTPASPVREGI